MVSNFWHCNLWLSDFARHLQKLLQILWKICKRDVHRHLFYGRMEIFDLYKKYRDELDRYNGLDPASLFVQTCRIFLFNTSAISLVILHVWSSPQPFQVAKGDSSTSFHYQKSWLYSIQRNNRLKYLISGNKPLLRQYELQSIWAMKICGVVN